ncbi:hypothetical protein GALMADRAFT_927641 [Galerina marginata CBS 339.88]|uniref:Uncharacterized protein n=1 Tax=Galerina marginata (strain CBS 339.88) TaxID=685588 RepID=A0A067SEH0_GALM3|nr:hypothetical protein GALMADRAFT_927641 [Galerina marginata CBS 339.88]
MSRNESGRARLAPSGRGRASGRQIQPAGRGTSAIRSSHPSHPPLGVERVPSTSIGRGL